MHRIDRLRRHGPLLGAGELLRSGEVVLRPQDVFTAPETVFVWSDTGSTGCRPGARFVARAARAPGHVTPGRPQTRGRRSTTGRSWNRCSSSPARRPTSGSSGSCSTTGGSPAGGPTRRRSVTGRSTPRSGRTARPARRRGACARDGLRALVRAGVRQPVSALAEAHPDWFLQDPDQARTWRHEYTLDFAKPAVREHVLDQMSEVIEEHHVDFVKWDQNRDVVQTVHAGRVGLGAHTRGVLRGDGRTAPTTPVAGGRVLRVRRRPGRPRRARTDRPGVGPRTRTTRWSGWRSSGGPSCCCRSS